MPMDYASYLLSSSPPSFDVQFKNQMCLREEDIFRGMDGVCKTSASNHVKAKLAEVNGVAAKLNGLLLNGINVETNSGSDRPAASEQEKQLSPSLKSPNRLKKTVSFADENGLALSQVKIFSESPNSPPIFRKGFITSLTRGATAAVTEQPPLTLKFAQPVSDYSRFREKLEKFNISLENVILKDYSLQGTIKVKNIAFEKRVFVRCTFDSWLSHMDIDATFVNMKNKGHTALDTFSFQISVPPTVDPKRTIQFVICYEVDGKEFWDNNNEQNYVVASQDWRATPSATGSSARMTSSAAVASPFDVVDDASAASAGLVFSADPTNWSEFSSWNDNSPNANPFY